MKKKILFGAGQLGFGAIRFFGEDAVYCFVDNDTSKSGKIYCGKKIISFDELLNIYDENKYEIIITATRLPIELISKQLLQAGIKNFKPYSRLVIYDNVVSIKESIAKELVSSKNLDVVVRYLYAKDIFSGIKDSPNKSLYARVMIIQSNVYEETLEKTKSGMDEYFEQFESLCTSMQKDGFKKDKFIPISKNNSIYDGAHRLAVALALDKNVFIGDCGGDRNSENVLWGFDWFEKNGFSFNDKVSILGGFADIYDECGMFVLFSPVREHWDYIQAQIRKEFTVVGFVDIDLSHNFIAFEILIREIYGDYIENSSIADKVSFLKMSPLVLRVILVSNEAKQLEANKFYDSITKLKLQLRDSLDYDIKNNSFCNLHGSSCYNEFVHLKNVLLSVNNLKSIEGRISPIYRREFLRRVSFVRDYCKENNIPINEICVVGSSTMEILGIKKAGDLDFILSSAVESKVLQGKKFISLESDASGENVIGIIASNQYYIPSKDVMIDKDVLINNDQYHIYFYGCKFLSLDMVAISKTIRNTSKDITDLRTIELYKDYIKSFDDKKILKERIEAELKWREEMRRLWTPQ